MRILGISNSISFQRRPNKNEELEIKETVNKAYELMGTDKRAVITHGSCFPAYLKDTHIGSPYSKAAREYIKFLSVYGFNCIQLGPSGELEKGVNSPYKSSAFSHNRMFIDLDELTTEKYGNLLSRETFEKVTSDAEACDKNYSMTDFDKAKTTYETALAEVYQNFKANPIFEDEYRDFLTKNEKRLIEEGVFKALSNEYGTDDFKKWGKDATLLTDIKKGDYKAKYRFLKVEADNFESIEQHKLEQFLINKQIKEHKIWRKDFEYISDLLVGCSKMDEWRHEDAFLKDWEMGAYEGNEISQRWRIPVIDPKKLFTADGLNIGGEFLKEKIDMALSFCENVRIDHVLGLVEPYLISSNASDDDLDTYPHHIKNKDAEKFISELRDETGAEYDTYWDYTKIIERIVLPAFKEHGLDKNNVVWEDICSWPSRFKAVYDKHNLPKTSNSDWYMLKDVIKNEPNNWFLLGNHDNIPAMNYPFRTAKMANGEDILYTRKQDAYNTKYLAEYLNQDESRENIQKIRENTEKLLNESDRELILAKFKELLTTPKFQITFNDLLGITDITYNVAGKELESNWKARISPDYQDKYYENLSGENPTALNIPELLCDALQAKLDMKVKEHNYDEKYRSELYAQYEPILEKLAHFAEVLKES